MTDMVTTERVGQRLGERFWSGIPDASPLALERSAIKDGIPWLRVDVKGLAYYEFGHDDGLGGVVRPEVGDRLIVKRRPENRNDMNAIEIWWRNGVHLGHVPRHHAAWLAPEIDAGKGIKAYVVLVGSHSMDAMLLGAAVEARGERSPPGP